MTGRAAARPVVSSPDHVTCEWLTMVTGATVSSYISEDVGTGQVGSNVRFRLTYEDPSAGPVSIVCKFPSADPTSRATGRRIYRTEVAFYREIAPTVDIRVPRHLHSEVDPETGDFVLALEDLGPAVPGDQIEGCTVAQAELAMVEAARLHGPRWGDPSLAGVSWLGGGTGSTGMRARFFASTWPGFVERYAGMLTPESLLVGEVAAGASGYGTGTAAPPTVEHGDFRLDNMLFGTSEGGYPLAVVDWQTVSVGAGPADVSYFLGAGPRVGDRRAHERDLVGLYHETLVSYGVRDYSLDACWQDYRRFAYGGFFMAVFASAVVGQTDRGDRMFAAMANGAAQQILDLDSAALLER